MNILFRRSLFSLAAIALLALPVGAQCHPFGSVAYQHTKALSHGIGQRVAGTSAETQTAEYIAAQLRMAGYAPAIVPFDSPDENEQGDPQIIHSANVIAEKAGRSSQVLIVGAHYDSVEIGRGADDNASGVGVLLEAATRIRNTTTPYTVRFIFFGAEEAGNSGRHGSTQYVAGLTATEQSQIVAYINVDSVLVGDRAYVYGDAGSQGKIRDWSLAWAAKHGYALETQPGENPDYPAGTTGLWSDHAPFVKAGIPYAYFEATNWSLGDKDGDTQVAKNYGEKGRIWHTKYDNLHYANRTFPGRSHHHLELFSQVLHAVLTRFKN